MADRRAGVYLHLIGCLLFGLFTGRPFFFNLAYLFGALLIGALIWSWVSVSWIRISRQTHARRAQVGKTLDEQFSVSNGGWLPKLWLEVRDHSTLPGHHASRVAPLLMPRARYSWTAHTMCTVRGEFTLGPITLLSGDPFGMFQTTRHIAATSTLLVYPAIVPIYDFAIPAGVMSGGDAQRQRAHFVTTNAAGVRDYVPGDSFNRIHWRSSARKDRLLVKEFELDPLSDVWMFLDLSAQSLMERTYTVTGNEFFIPPSSEEYGVVVAASLAQYFLTKERTLGFLTYNPLRCLLQPDRGNRQLTRILETLAVAKSTGEIGFNELIALEGHHMARGATVILISADPTPSWVNEAHLLVRRSLRVVAILLDPASFGGTTAIDEQALLLEGSGATTYLVRNGDDISLALARR